MLADAPRAEPNPVLVEAFSLLERRGARVERWFANAVGFDMDAGPDREGLYLFKSRSAFWCEAAAWLHARGARLLDPWPARVLVHNKALVMARLREAGVPAPRTWLTRDPAVARRLLAEGPVVLKPNAGAAGEDVRFIHRSEEVPERLEQPAILQPLLGGTGEDLKVYVIGSRAFGLRKRFGPGSYRAPGEPCALEPAVEALALRVGEVLGLTLYGLDFVEGPEGPVPVDVNWFPSYRSVPEAPRLLCEHVWTHLTASNRAR
jgi:glutathione synthase/RimK-type ligase-like ATP-grasp enzyme